MRKDGYKRMIDNKSRDYGQVSYSPKMIRVNMKKSSRVPFRKKTGVEGQADTIYHEEMHAKHPNMKERTVRKKTRLAMDKMPVAKKKKLVARYKKKASTISSRDRRKFHQA